MQLFDPCHLNQIVWLYHCLTRKQISDAILQNILKDLLHKMQTVTEDVGNCVLQCNNHLLCEKGVFGLNYNKYIWLKLQVFNGNLRY